jgi:quercetin dioxygenase-like cupin family protein
MDISVTSIDMLARLFNHSLRNRGFTRAIHREMYAGQSSGMQQHHFGVLGLVVAGELELELAEAHQTLGIGEEFTIPANIYFQVTAGHSGAQLLLAKKRNLISSKKQISCVN